MGNLTPIRSLTPNKIRAAVAAALDAERPVATIADFVSDVDWSTIEGVPDAEVTALLGRLHELTTAVDEGDLDKSAFLEAVRVLAGKPASTRQV